jgi:hypothetical protein
MENAARGRGWFRPLWFLAIAVLVVLAGNAHLLYVAFTSQPECVAHLKEKSGLPGQFRAANSDC